MSAIPQTPQTDNTTRGHVEQKLGRGVVCLACKKRKPKRGGWSHACALDMRTFMGGNP
jgi:hypothetical protein